MKERKTALQTPLPRGAQAANVRRSTTFMTQAALAFFVVFRLIAVFATTVRDMIIGIKKATAVLAVVTLGWTHAYSQEKVVLVTASEAALPSVSVGELSRRGVTRGPKITLVSPAKNDGNTSPLHFELKFETFGGAKIDPQALKVSYLKKPPVDLTDRVKPFFQGADLDIKQAELPPGNHVIRVDVKDTDGRLATALFTFNVVP